VIDRTVQRANNVTMIEEPVFSLVLPVKDEADNIPQLCQEISKFLNELDSPAEVIFVDDGSTDDSVRLLREFQKEDPRFLIVELSRNFGHQIAITAGLDLAKGKAAVVLDSDLQDPLSVIHTMIREWKAGYEIVYGVRQARKDEGTIRRLMPWIYYRMMKYFFNVAVPFDVGDFRLIDRRALESFRSMRERNRYVRGMFAWIGFRAIGVPYVREGRTAGKSKYGWRKLANLALNGFFSFSYFPVKLSILTGFCFSSLFLLLSILYPVVGVSGFYQWSLRTEFMLLLLFLGGMNLLMLGAIGIYVIRAYDEVRARPLYIIRNVFRVGSLEPTEQSKHVFT
jgi:polyisoprenyl-phosphate glycosyltransferase